MEEKELILLAQNGDDMAFGILMERYQNAVFNLCYRMLNNAQDAEDAAQEIFIKAYRAIRSFDIERKFSTWILSISSNYCIDQYRKRKLKTLSLEDSPYEDIHDESQKNMEKMLTDREKEKEIQLLLDNLQPKDRAAIVMFYWEDYSYDEIAEALDLSLGAVKSRLFRARKTLAEIWLEKKDAANHSILAERTHNETILV
jgi:RNA polymerase sigma-70 factor (ECF subfamily)